jgi:hypothetical protein
MYFRDHQDEKVKRLEVMLSSELQIRSLAPDIDDIEGFAAVQAKALSVVQDMQADPSKWENANRELGERIAETLDKVNKATRH